MKPWLFALLVAAAPQEDCEMAQKPVLYPGSVVSRNSQVRQAALQGGAYAAPAAANPATRGFLGADQTALDDYTFTSGAGVLSRQAIAGRLGGYLPGDTGVGYLVTWWGVRATGGSTEVTLRTALYALSSDGRRARRIAGTVAEKKVTTTGNVTNRGEYISALSFEVPSDVVILAAVAMVSDPGAWGPGDVGVQGLTPPTFNADSDVSASGSVAVSYTLVAGTESDLLTDVDLTGNGTTGFTIPSVAVVTKRNVFTQLQTYGNTVMPL